MTEILRNLGEDSAYDRTVLEKMQGVENWMQRRQMPHSIRKDIRKFYMKTWAISSEPGEVEYFQDLPGEIRARVARSMQSTTLEYSIFGEQSEDVAPELRHEAMVSEFLNVLFQGWWLGFMDLVFIFIFKHKYCW